ncbi:sensor histidine kinase [Sphaerisporangium sp. B11E5]|uniref:HAMP domain-containing sensor histidine kinase n=1 Tax=Sphaerisporangium sp. B11E5 TaxID=3153563 RepID=UPI00325DC458
MWRFGLRARTAASYVLVTAAAVLIVESVLLGLVITSESGSDLVRRVQYQAGKDAKVIGATLGKVNAFSPGLDQWNALLVAMKTSAAETGFGADDPKARELPFSGTSGAVEVLTDSTGRVVGSTAAEVYAPGSVLAATQGQMPEGLGGKGETPLGTAVWWVSPVLAASGSVLIDAKPGAAEQAPADGKTSIGPDKPIKNLKTVGFVYVQAPVDLRVLPIMDAIAPLLAPGVLVLALVVPVGVVFGMLSTRGLISRITRLAAVTTAVAGGDFTPRVAVRGDDEVSRLEDGFNRMAERLGAAVEAERHTARVDARQAERARIARELHDSISQDLFSLSLLAAGMRRAAPAELGRESEAMERTAARTLREMQALLLELRPVALEDAGLIPALEELCRAYESRLGITVRTALEEVVLPPAAEHALLRLTQEALGNAVKHGSPGAVEVRLSGADDEVRLRIADDGRGFDPAPPSPSHGMGLKLMRERVEELGGTFTVTSGPGAGTVVTASVPLPVPVEVP